MEGRYGRRHPHESFPTFAAMPRQKQTRRFMETRAYFLRRSERVPIATKARSKLILEDRVFTGDRSQRLANLAAVVALLAVTMSVGCERRVASAPPPAAPDVEVTPVIQKDMPVEGEWIGTL